MATPEEKNDKKRFCKIIKTETRTSLGGSEIWVLTHECGKVQERVKRMAMSRHNRKAPTRLQCDKESK